MDRIQVSVNHWRSCREGTAGTSGSLGFRGDGQYHRMEGRSLSEMTSLNGSNFGQLANFSKERQWELPGHWQMDTKGPVLAEAAKRSMVCF